jgi:AraC-like DNA-binding protein
LRSLSIKIIDFLVFCNEKIHTIRYIIPLYHKKKMDISTNMTGKKRKSSEINVSPIPASIRSIVCKSGMWICTYYDNINSGLHKSLSFRAFDFYVITHLIDGNGIYFTPDMDRPAKLDAGWAVIATPGVPNTYGGDTKPFVEDSIGFLGPNADALKKAGVIRDGAIYLGKERRLLPIMEKIREGTLASQLEANTMLKHLFFKLRREQMSRKDYPELTHRLDLLMNEIRNDLSIWWTVQDMAEFCNISENYLRQLFHSQTGMSPKEYLDSIKMNRATELLTTSDLKIYQIAERLGYSDAYHFNRRFSNVIGISPGKYRKQFSPHQS